MPFDNAPERNIGMTLAARMIKEFDGGRMWRQGWGENGSATCLAGMVGRMLHGDVRHYTGSSTVIADEAPYLVAAVDEWLARNANPIEAAARPAHRIIAVNDRTTRAWDGSALGPYQEYATRILPLLRRAHQLELAAMSERAEKRELVHAI